MLYLESFVHRVRLAEVVSRWVVNQPQPGDVATLKQIVNFNAYLIHLWMDELASTVLGRLHGRSPRSFVAKTKGQLKDFIVEHPQLTDPRTERLFQYYRAAPEEFYRETPFDGRVYYVDTPTGLSYVGSSRIKRFRRIAEKGGRRIVDYLFERIRANADALAEERARRLGIPKHELITPQAEQVEEFLQAEKRLLNGIRQTSIQHEFPVLSIPDVAGIKVIIEENQFEQLVEALVGPSCTLLEQEHHTGRYNAINLRLAYRIPRDRLLAKAPSGHHLQVLRYRGFDPATAPQLYRQFLETAEDHVLLEVIVSSYAEFLESEIGRSMHEDRIVAQRSTREYNGHLGTNVLYLMDYILSLCLAPANEDLTDVPIKLWVKYMPDTMDGLLRNLYRIPVDPSFDDTSNSYVEAGPWPALEVGHS